MNRKLASIIASVIVLIGMLSLSCKIHEVKAGGTYICIMPDGSIVPSTANMTTVDNVTYVLTNNYTSDFDGIVVLRDNIVVDGAGYTLRGSEAHPYKGIYLSSRSNVTIQNMGIEGFYYSVYLEESHNNSIHGLNIMASAAYCIKFYRSSNNTISGNVIVNNNQYGIDLGYSSNNVISGNHIENNTSGIYLSGCSNNILENNTLVGNRWNFDIWGDELSHFVNDIDTSNTINGKSIYYLTNMQNIIIDTQTLLDIGYLAVINSTNVTVQNLNMEYSGQGILFAYTNHSRIRNVSVTENSGGIELVYSSNNTIVGNNVTDNITGIELFSSSNNNSIAGNNIIQSVYLGIRLYSSSSNNSIVRNNIRNSQFAGIGLFGSSNNYIIGNNLSENNRAIEPGSSYNNKIFHNNFINNTEQVYLNKPVLNFWDNGFEGNYWSNYIGEDLDHDGIRDTSHFIYANNTDHYPLMGMFHGFNTTLGEYVNVISNSTIDSFEYSELNNTIKMYISNMTVNQTFGFCRVCIPYTLMDVINITVTINNGLTEVLYFNNTIYDNSTHRWIYFAYEHSTHEIIIVPEFPHALILLLFMITALLSTLACKRVKYRSKSQLL